ncbi:hypothetical protein SAMN05446037_101776 [Anaerovirgula multivorans]|uniref:Uncharacterized protein n=1 Tax=Anaerovirgula multivorans TaxID=312168 RepID=A0A239GNG6_9FIRM|nr:hypothetical protein [Anaerovirgula multivorans]SNS70043.1 hypothetical protein SAMN05446037_101776 [Anaerovirgula multivorans]
MSDYEIVTGKRMNEVKAKEHEFPSTRTDRILDASIDNFDKILDLAFDIVEMGKMKIQTDAIIRKMGEDRKYLLAEAEAYVMKKQSDTDQMVEKMNFIKDMMNQFYKHNDNKISGDEFSKIMCDIVKEIGNL